MPERFAITYFFYFPDRFPFTTEFSSFRKDFENLNRGDYETVLKNVSPRVTHSFSDNHAPGGTRHGIEGMQLWFGPLFRFSPGLAFEIQNVAVSSWPWHTIIAMEWLYARATPVEGSDYVNEGVHVINMRWGCLSACIPRHPGDH